MDYAALTRLTETWTRRYRDEYSSACHFHAFTVEHVKESKGCPQTAMQKSQQIIENDSKVRGERCLGCDGRQNKVPGH